MNLEVLKLDSKYRMVDRIAFIAHTADGEKRADGFTPYIAHPRRVAELVLQWQVEEVIKLSMNDLQTAMQAALLHDVLEDTGITREDLIYLGVGFDVLDIVERLTKKDPNAPATPEYYQGIADSDLALIVKCGDRCANLEDSLQEVLKTNMLKRWRKYVDKTYNDVLPMYKTLPKLRAQIVDRLTAIETELVPREAERAAFAAERKAQFENKQAA